MNISYYLPCLRVRPIVDYWRWLYGCDPLEIGRLDVYESSGVRYLQGPVYIGPVPREDVGLWNDYLRSLGGPLPEEYSSCRRVTLVDQSLIHVWRNSQWELEFTGNFYDLLVAEEEEDGGYPEDYFL